MESEARYWNPKTEWQNICVCIYINSYKTIIYALFCCLISFSYTPIKHWLYLLTRKKIHALNRKTYIPRIISTEAENWSGRRGFISKWPGLKRPRARRSGGEGQRHSRPRFLLIMSPALFNTIACRLLFITFCVLYATCFVTKGSCMNAALVE